MTLAPDSVDLLKLTLRLQRGEALASGLEGFLEGKTRLRDAVARELDCSQSEAEQLTDTLVLRGFVQFRDLNDEPTTAGSVPGYWRLVPRE
jgi:hypothetical protein